MAIDWVTLLPSIVYSRIVSDFPETVKTKYKMTKDNFSTVSMSATNAVFPFVYVNTLAASERGQDLQNTDINGGLFGFQVDVIDNQSQSRAREIMKEVMRIMKRMRFNVTEIPYFESTQDEYRQTARFQRVIGNGDIL